VNSSTIGAMITVRKNDVVFPEESEFRRGMLKIISKINAAITAIVAPQTKQ
jgi:hypothetical protein